MLLWEVNELPANKIVKDSIAIMFGLILLLYFTNPVLTAIAGVDLTNVGGTDLSFLPPLLLLGIYLIFVYKYFDQSM